MSEKLLSICVAAYNSEQYIEKMLGSVLNASSIDDIEIVVVNDGSSDNTAGIIKRYVNMYPDIIVGINQDNKGSGGAWNNAFKNATGKYIKTIDSDDMVNTENLDLYVARLRSIDSDMIINPHYTEYTYKKKSILTNNLGIAEGEYNIAAFLPYEDISMHDVTYRNSPDILGQLEFMEHVSYGDMEYLTIPIKNIKSIYYVDIPVYIYKIGIEGQSISPLISIKKNDQRIAIANKIINYRNINRHSNDAYKWVNNQVVRMLKCVVLDYCNSGSYAYKNDIKKYDLLIKDMDQDLYKIMNEDKIIRLLRITDYNYYYCIILAKKIKNAIF
ncbi:glycosyltransferase family 2 protein [Butyrivibrio fibrisolvens]|uniref:Glycosyltransferase 2-like domain-containing protein n=1 Tax=Butyrivibrio fibrisolvens TaxID=831 RepID=A0A317FWI8_BUTFI|nr:glycosyltransferase family 2 protein [Butyrivibrio fibrisolvens]PWT26034.1 hypothetical protein CPT75_02335 [Butyrivibrio fibrisolvens]